MESPAPPPAERDRQNRLAWDNLYRSTAEPVWGRQPVGFLEPCLRDFAAALPPAGRVLDAGAGEGRNLSVLRRLGTEVTACDASPAALAKIPGGGPARVESVCCELAHTPFAAGRFDTVFLIDVIETLPDPGPALRELHRILAPGGRLLCNLATPEDGAAGRDLTCIGAGQFLYRDRYFYRFYAEADGIQLLNTHGFAIQRRARYTWEETSHPEYRPNQHRHTSWVFLAGKPPG